MTEILSSPAFTSLRCPHVETALTPLVDSRQTATALDRIYNTSGLLLRVDADAAITPDTAPDTRGGTVHEFARQQLRSMYAVEGMLESITSVIFERHALPDWHGDYAVEDFAPLTHGETPDTLENAHQDICSAMTAVAAGTLQVPGQEALANHLSNLREIVESAMDCWETAFWNCDDARIREEAIIRLGWDPSRPDDAASLPDAP